MDLYYREQHNKRVIIGRSGNLDFPPHLHEDLELVYMEQGSCTAHCGEDKYELHVGDFFLAFPNQVHHYYGSTDCQAVLIIVNPAYLSGFSKETSTSQPNRNTFLDRTII